MIHIIGWVIIGMMIMLLIGNWIGTRVRKRKSGERLVSESALNKLGITGNELRSAKNMGQSHTQAEIALALAAGITPKMYFEKMKDSKATREWSEELVELLKGELKHTLERMGKEEVYDELKEDLDL